MPSSPPRASHLILTDALRSQHIAYHATAADGLSLLGRLLLVHGVNVQTATCTLDICCRTMESHGEPELWDALRALQLDDLFLTVNVDPMVFQVTRKGKLQRRRIIKALKKASAGPTAAEHLSVCETTLSVYLMSDNV